MAINCLVFLLVFAGFSASSSIDNPRVITKSGVVIGKFVNLEGSVFKNGSGYAFLGIPYAEAPIGSLRFKKPVYVKSWTRPLDATHFGPICPQFGSKEEASEDCLTLNVFTSRLPATSNSSGLPVMVYLHGGSLLMGSARELGHDGIIHNLASRGVILITVQYRLGTLGFLSTGNSILPGNRGTHDQHLALQWIHDNVEHFGGDNTRVTLFGQSAGGCSVSALSMSPIVDQKLFQQYIIQSATVEVCFQGTLGDGSSLSKERVHQLCNITVAGDWTQEESKNAYECLENIPIRRILEADGSNYGGWKLIVDGEILPKLPKDMIAESTDMRPVLMGHVKDEFAAVEVVLGPFDIRNYSEAATLRKVNNFLAEYYPLHAAQVFPLVQQNYLDPLDELENVTNRDRFLTYSQIGTDCVFLSRVALEAQRRQLKGQDVYLYTFAYVGTSPKLGNDAQIVGHAMELPYIFMQEQYFNEKTTNADWHMGYRMGDFWTNFAKTGKLYASSNASDSATESYLIIDRDLSYGENYGKRAKHVWDVEVSVITGLRPPPPGSYYN